MSNDRELLELAAKAAGITLNWSDIEGGRPRRADTWDAWNPLEDDGDALRLAAKLHISIVHRRRLSDGEEVAVAAGLYSDQYDETETYYDEDPEAATRRAIVRAAAEIGRTK